jgi:hypothetical protein
MDAYAEFYQGVDKHFALRAAGHTDIPAHATRGYWINNNKDVKEFYLRIEPADFARMESGVEYELSWLGKADGFAWKVFPTARITRPKR